MSLLCTILLNFAIECGYDEKLFHKLEETLSHPGFSSIQGNGLSKLRVLWCRELDLKLEIEILQNTNECEVGWFLEKIGFYPILL